MTVADKIKLIAPEIKPPNVEHISFLLTQTSRQFTSDIRCTSDAELAQLSRGLVENWNEHMMVVCVDGAHRVIRTDIAAVGDDRMVLCPPRSIFFRAIACLADHIAIVHNHPSGEPTPSEADIKYTTHLVELGQMLGVPVVGSIVVAESPSGFAYKSVIEAAKAATIITPFDFAKLTNMKLSPLLP